MFGAAFIARVEKSLQNEKITASKNRYLELHYKHV
jgi:hypothetical protein